MTALHTVTETRLKVPRDGKNPVGGKAKGCTKFFTYKYSTLRLGYAGTLDRHGSGLPLGHDFRFRKGRPRVSRY